MAKRKNIKGMAKVKKREDKTFSILDKAWKIQSAGLRAEGKCVGCGSGNGLIAGHLVHGGRGKAWNLVDFNVNLYVQNIFCQCAFCNTYDPDGNGKLTRHFLGIYEDCDYEYLKGIKQRVWRPNEDEAKDVLQKTKERYE